MLKKYQFVFFKLRFTTQRKNFVFVKRHSPEEHANGQPEDDIVKHQVVWKREEGTVQVRQDKGEERIDLIFDLNIQIIFFVIIIFCLALLWRQEFLSFFMFSTKDITSSMMPLTKTLCKLYD